MKNKTIIFKNLKNLSKVCPLEKIQVFNDNIILVVKPKLLFDVLLFLNNRYWGYQLEFLGNSVFFICQSFNFSIFLCKFYLK